MVSKFIILLLLNIVYFYIRYDNWFISWIFGLINNSIFAYIAYKPVSPQIQGYTGYLFYLSVFLGLQIIILEFII